MSRIKFFFPVIILLLAAGCATTNNPSAIKPLELNFETSDSEIIQDGNKAASQEDWDTAVKDWKEAAASEEPTDQTAAQYNLALYAETKGRLPEALTGYQQAKQLGNTDKFDGDIARVQKQIDAEKEKSNAAATAATPEPAATAAIPSAAGQDELDTWKTNPGLKVAKEKGLHRFNWEPVANATGYHVYTAKAKGKPFKQLNHKLLSKPQLRAKALPRGKVLVQVAVIGPDGNEIARSQPVRMTMP